MIIKVIYDSDGQNIMYTYVGLLCWVFCLGLIWYDTIANGYVIKNKIITIALIFDLISCLWSNDVLRLLLV